MTRVFSPRNPRTIAQQANRQAFKDLYMSSLTQAQADLLYAAIMHLHDDRYSLLEHVHEAGGSGLTLLTADPVTPDDGETWLLRETIGAMADGSAMGLMGMTYTDNDGVIMPLQLSVNDNGAIRRLQFQEI